MRIADGVHGGRPGWQLPRADGAGFALGSGPGPVALADRAPWPSASDQYASSARQGVTRALQVHDRPAVYRPRHPERTAFYQLFEGHWDEYCRVHEERYEPVSGPLRPEVLRAVPAYLECGRLQNGFARLRCETCGQEEFLAYSCGIRQLCPSCQAKRAVLFGERLAEEVLSPEAAHQHVVWTIPIRLRGLFRRDPRLIGLLSRCAYTALRVWLQTILGDEVVPGFVSCLHTFGAQAANYHPHLHSLASLGGFTKDGEFVPVDELDCGAIEQLFRRLVLDELIAADWLQEETRERFLAWEHSGFSVFAHSASLRAARQGASPSAPMIG